MATYSLDTQVVHDLDLWVDLMNTYICPLDYQQPARGAVASQETADYYLGHWLSTIPTTARRTLSQIRRDGGTEWHQFLLILKGSVLIERDGQQVQAGPGTLAPFPTDVPLSVSTKPLRVMNVRFPRAVIDDRMNPSSTSLHHISTDKGMGRIAAEMIYSLYRERDHLTESQFNAVCNHLASLLCTLLQGDHSSATADHLSQVGEKIRQYVRRNAAKADLSLQQVGADLGWSTRQIQAALQHTETTYRDLIRDTRLHIARNRLSDPACNDLSIADIAEASGFSPHRLSVTFKAEYGESPREFRARS